jgi:hypothetical protein
VVLSVSPGLEVGDLNSPILRHRLQLLGLQFTGHIARLLSFAKENNRAEYLRQAYCYI